jgi:hypothetical protein
MHTVTGEKNGFLTIANQGVDYTGFLPENESISWLRLFARKDIMRSYSSKFTNRFLEVLHNGDEHYHRE